MPYRAHDRPMLTPPVVPLTRCTEAGAVYTRRPEREAEIHYLVALPTRTVQQECLSTRAPDDAIVGSVSRVPSMAEGTHAESLAYFVRECRHRDDESAGNWLAAQVMARTELFILHHLRGLNETHREAAHDEVIGKIFHEMCDDTHTSGDYYQVSFWNVLNRRCMDAYKRHDGKSRWETRHIAHPTAVHRSNGELLDPLDRIADGDPLPDTLPGEDDVVQRGLRYLGAHLPGNLTTEKIGAFSLRYLSDLPIGECGKPGTIADHYGVSARTITNWFTAVRDALEAWIQEEAA